MPGARATALRMEWTMPAVWMSALLGMQPVQVQSPPIRSFSISNTFAPTALANGAATSPAEPAPITTRS